MYKFSRLSCLVLITVSLIHVSFSQQKDPLSDADQLMNGREYQKAVDAYKQLLADTADAPTKARIFINLGKTYRMLRQYDLSIDSFKEAAELDTVEPVPTNKVPRLPVYRAQAGVEISKSLFAKGDFAGALSTFRAASGTRRVSTGCGTCNESIERERNITEGIYLESVGKYDEAVTAYLKADEPHLAELYFKAGQLDDLREFVERDIAALIQKYSWRRDYAEQNSRYRSLLAMINAYDLEKQAKWQELIKLAVIYDRSRDFGRNNIPATILARHADKIIPLLKVEMKNFRLVRQMNVIYGILALSGTDASITFLNELAPKGSFRSDSFLILGQIYRHANENDRKKLNGIKSLTEIEPWAQFYFERDDIDEFGRFEIKFSQIGEVPKLPRSSEIQL